MNKVSEQMKIFFDFQTLPATEIVATKQKKFFSSISLPDICKLMASNLLLTTSDK